MANLETLATLGENEALRRTVSRLKNGPHVFVGSGDDSAVIKTTDNQFLVSTDTMIENHDFKTVWSSAFDLGWKAVATNLADIAAMGAEPTALVVALAVPTTTEIAWLENFADGLQAALDLLAPNASVVGGDLTSADQIFISVTVHGQLNGKSPILRSGAKPGDVVAVAGTLGKAAAGLDLLFSGDQDAISAYDEVVSIQLRPIPPIQAVCGVKTASAMLDISDGLAKDANRIAKASGVQIDIDPQSLDGYRAVLDDIAQRLGKNSLDWVLFGGEDHSFLATFPKNAQIPRFFKPIGRVIEGVGVFLGPKALPDKGWDSVAG